MTNLEKIIDNIHSEHVYIQTHNFPDPDAIASAFGLQKLLEARGIISYICYKGKIDRYNIHRMIKTLGIELFTFTDDDVITKDDEIILIDGQKGNFNTIDYSENDIMCIDHHPIYNDISYKFSDIRGDVGACASIIAEYFYENNINITRTVATALLYGIKVDTANLTRGVSELDLDMFYALYKICDLSELNFISMSTLQLDDLDAYASAIKSIKVYDHISFANTGKDCPEALIASISDFMLDLEEVTFSVVYSIKADGIKISVRSVPNGYDAGILTSKALKDIGTGGGHETMAGGFVPFSDKNQSVNLIITKIESRFIKTVSQSSQNDV